MCAMTGADIGQRRAEGEGGQRQRQPDVDARLWDGLLQEQDQRDGGTPCQASLPRCAWLSRIKMRMRAMPPYAQRLARQTRCKVMWFAVISSCSQKVKPGVGVQWSQWNPGVGIGTCARPLPCHLRELTLLKNKKFNTFSSSLKQHQFKHLFFFFVVWIKLFDQVRAERADGSDDQKWRRKDPWVSYIVIAEEINGTS